jgi:hypothetical protein
MALTQAEWYKKLKAFVPEWYFENEHFQVGHFQALAKLLAQIQADADDSIEQTFIDTADGGYLDLHGSERTVPRFTGELDAPYRPRIKAITNTVNRPALKALVDSLLVVGECIITEDYENSLFFSRGVYQNRAFLLITNLYNAFTIVLENQTHEPYSFLDRGAYMSRGDYMGELAAPQELFESIVSAVNKAKAFGVFYRLVERTQNAS